MRGSTTTVYLLAGTYDGPLALGADFSARAEPLVVRPAPGLTDGDVIFDGEWDRTGGGIRWQGIEFAASAWTTRVSAEADGGDLPDYNWNANGAADEYVNCVVHDHNSNAFFAAARAARVYGCLFYNQGWEGPVRGHGHALYTQNDEADGVKRVERCVLVKGFSDYNLHLYGSSSAALTGYAFAENAHVGGTALHGGSSPVDGVDIDGSHFAGAVQLGYDAGVTNGALTMAGCVVENGAYIQSAPFTDLSVTGTVTGSSHDGVYAYGNDYDDDRGLVVVWNAAEAATLDVDLSALPLTNGRDYELVNCLNPAETHPFTYSGAAVPVPMAGWTVALPVAHDEAVVESTFPAFGCFILRAA